jgi:hypothetical protein
MRFSFLINQTFMKKLLLSIFSICVLALQGYAQKQVNGRVVAGADGLPLPGVSVMEKSSKKGAVTDANGRYNITVADGSSVLIFSFLGFETREVSVGTQSTINVTLNESAKTLNEVVVTGALGIQRNSKELGYSAQTINSDDLNSNKQSNIVNALQGKIEGVTISS